MKILKYCYTQHNKEQKKPPHTHTQIHTYCRIPFIKVQNHTKLIYLLEFLLAVIFGRKAGNGDLEEAGRLLECW